MLLTDEYRQKIAETIFVGIETHRYGLAERDCVRTRQNLIDCG